MIYLLHGNNFTKVRGKLREIISFQLKKDPEATYFKIEPDTWDEEKIKEIILSAGLFQKKYIIVLDGLLADKTISENLLEMTGDLAKSQNIFIFIEEELTKEAQKKLGKKAEKSQEFFLETEFPRELGNSVSKDREFKIFSLADALGRREKEKLWILFHRALFSGNAVEQIHGILFWQVKSMLVARKAGSAGASALNPFVYKKSLGFLRNFKEGELESISSQLVRIYHDSHRGITDFGVALEKWILGI